MSRLLGFELEKIGRRRSFRIALVLLLVIHVFLLWYTNLSDGVTPELSSYKAIELTMETMSEAEKYEYIETLYKDIEGIRHVVSVLSFRAMSGEMGAALAKQALAENPGVFEKYYPIYEEGSYPKYTASLEQETVFLTTIYAEMEKVSAYHEYLEEVQSRKDTLQGISIFAEDGSSSFSSRNIEQSAADYRGLDSVRTAFFPSKGIVSATQSDTSDLVLLLSVFFVVGSLIMDEKDKKLFYVTKATAAGRGKSIAAKLAALAVHCTVFSALIYGVNLLYFAATAGVGDLLRSIQSVAPYMESTLRISVLSYLLLTVLTKAMVLFSFGAFLMAVSIIAKQSFAPYLAGAAILAVSLLLYGLIPAYSSVNWLKYLNLIGLLKAEAIYTGYLNFNLFDYPVSRLLLSWVTLALCLLGGFAACVFSFLKCRNLELRKLRLPVVRLFRPHSSLYRHESFKILIMNRAVIVLLIFAALLGYQHLTAQVTLSPKEAYYQSFMLQLEGELTPEKESMIKAETARYERAFAQIDRIDKLVASGKLDENTGDSMKAAYYSETAFYPAFLRVLDQFQFVQDWGGRFVYDTGYLYLFGVAEDGGMLLDLLLLTACMVLSFSGVMAMEYQKKSWNFLSATAKGRGRIVACKMRICLLASCALGLILWIFRLIPIARYYPLHGWNSSVGNLSAYHGLGMNIPIVGFFLLAILVQLITLIAATLITLLLSDKLKNQLQTLFIAVLLLLIPLVLKTMGFSFAGWCSLLPLYTAPSSLLTCGAPVLLLYLLALSAVSAGSVVLLKGHVKER